MDKLTKKYYRIREVAELLGVSLPTLRFWESKFTVIKPKRNEKGTRLYTPADIDAIATIHYLVKERGFKLDAAQELMRTNPDGISRKAMAVRRLHAIREELTCMIEALDRRVRQR